MSGVALDPLAPPGRPGFDPEQAPLDPSFTGEERGTAVPAERLQPEALRRRFAAPPAWRPHVQADGRLLDHGGPEREAAVLIPLLVRPQGLQVLLTERTAHLPDHASQISFPGGRVDPSDRDAVHTALREAQEEIGLPATHVDVLGLLPAYRTVTRYRVTPVAALVRPGFALAPDPFEVAEAFEVPLAFLMDPSHHERRRVRVGELERDFLAMPWTSHRRYFIWGATAGMLRNLYAFLRA